MVVNTNSESSNLNNTSRLCDAIGIFEEVKRVFVSVVSTSLVADFIKDAHCPMIS